MKSGDVLEVKVKGHDNKAVYIGKAPLTDQRKINGIFSLLRHKFNVFWKKIDDKEESWFDD